MNRPKHTVHAHTPHKTFIQSTRSFDDIPQTLVARAPGVFQMVPRVRLSGERLHQTLFASHRAVYSRVLEHYVAEKNALLETERQKLHNLAQMVIYGGPIETAVKKLKRTIVENASELQRKLESRASTAEKLNAIVQALNKLRRKILANQAIASILNYRDSTNFAIGEVTLFVTTKNVETGEPAKKLTISLPIKAQTLTYNYRNVDGVLFKRFFHDRLEASKWILAGDKVKFAGEGSTLNVYTCHSSRYPQLAFHSEKFMYYHLMDGGLAAIVDALPSRGITPENIYSFNGMILQMHSTKEMCGTCEAMSIGARQEMLAEFNRLLIERGYEGVETNTELAVDISADSESTRDLRSLARENHVSMRQRNISRLPPVTQMGYATAVSRAHDYTFFTSGGESSAPTALKQREIHQRSIATIQRQDREQWLELQTDAAIRIQRAFRAYKHSKELDNSYYYAALLDFYRYLCFKHQIPFDSL